MSAGGWAGSKASSQSPAGLCPSTIFRARSLRTPTRSARPAALRQQSRAPGFSITEGAQTRCTI
eukprot:6748604-Alexandrium_andersonii.AAC.1